MTRAGGRPTTAARTPRAGASFASSVRVRRRMQVQRTRDTAPELAVRRLLHAMGLRYRVDRQPLPGLRRRADVVFGPARVALYIDGCFWHGCPLHGNAPRANSEYWRTKLDGNRARDAYTDRRLAEAGWCVMRAWEHESPPTVAERVAVAVIARRPTRRERVVRLWEHQNLAEAAREVADVLGTRRPGLS